MKTFFTDTVYAEVGRSQPGRTGLAKGLEKSKQIIRPHGDNFKTSEIYVITINSVLL